MKYHQDFLNYIRSYRFSSCDEQLRVITCDYSNRDTTHHSNTVETEAVLLRTPPSYRDGESEEVRESEVRELEVRELGGESD
jgi:hypothetical protein